MLSLFSFFLLVALVAVISAQEDVDVDMPSMDDMEQMGDMGEMPPPGDAQRVELDRDSIEGIMQTVSGSCRSEIEAAMESKTDITDDCQGEIQAAIQTLNIQPRMTSANGEEEPEQARMTADEARAIRKERRAQERSERASRKNSKKNVIPPFVTFMAYITLFGGACYAFWKYNLSDAAQRKNKKKVRVHFAL